MSTNTSNQEDQASQYNHAWEQVDADINWASISEDNDGNLINSANPNSSATTLSSTTLANKIRRRRRHLTLIDHAQSSRRIVRDMIRYLYLLLDLSSNMYEKDPGMGQGANSTRLEVTLGLAQDFVVEYFDQNPLSHLGIVICKGGEAHVLSGLSGSRRAAIVALGAVREGMGKGMAKEAGQFSLQNGLEVAGRSLGHMPKYGSREIVILVGALSTCDPGDVLVDTLPKLQAAKIRANCLALTAEMHVCRKVSEETGGIMGVMLDGRHLRDLLMNFTAPPPALPDDDTNGSAKTCEFVPMGFPNRVTDVVPGLIHATSNIGKDKKLFFARTGYVCPRCKAKASELPTDCAVCTLKLVLAPHLARSFHHLFPVPPFSELAEDVELSHITTPTNKSVSEEPVLPVSSSSSSPTKVKPTPIYSLSTSLSSPSMALSNNAFIIPPNMGFHTSSSTFQKVDKQTDSSLLIQSTDTDRCCYVCLKIIGVKNLDEQALNHNNAQSTGDKKKKKKAGTINLQYEIVPELLRFQCPDCHNVFCADCDSYLHEILHNCPGCLRQ